MISLAPRRIATRILFFVTVFAFAFVPMTITNLLAQTVAPAQTCGDHNIRGGPVAGTFCGGTSGNAQCSSGALYKCSNANVADNCVLVQACASGCLASDSVQGQLTSACYTGPKALTITPNAPLGGEPLTLTAAVAAASAHPHGVILNLRVDRQDLVPGEFCQPDIPQGQSTETLTLSTRVVGTPTPVLINADFDWVDPTGVGNELATPTSLVTLEPGGQEPPPAEILSMVMNPTSTGPDGAGFMDITLAGPAPASGEPITVTSSDPAIAQIVAGSQPVVSGSCNNSVGNIVFRTPKNVPKTETITISASAGAPGQAPVTAPFTVNAGCVPTGCSGGPTCGTQSDGCGGTITGCGCFNIPNTNQVCGPNNTCIANPAWGITGMTVNPSSVPGGRTSIATITASGPAPAGGGNITLNSDNSFVQVPPFVTMPAGATSMTFTITTSTLATGTTTSDLIAGGGIGSAGATLTVTPTVACTPQTCAQLGKTCGSVPNGCGGTLSCGTCGAGTTCGGGGTANVCGGSASTAVLTVTASGGGGDITTTPSAGIKASSGKPASGVFDIGTSITLKTSDGHGAVWSGACSSGGAAASSCTFTFNGAASVNAANK
jgi:antitoxin (DNA-binding transcriptional repressor) of toxin-antitoxin stability system